MGTFTRTITLLSATGEAPERVEAVVDTGATFTSVPAPLLERLGVELERRVRLRLAGGQIAERSLGTVRAELDGVESTILCLFGEAGDPPVIGAHTLEAFLLAADPVGRRLVPKEGYLVGCDVAECEGPQRLLQRALEYRPVNGAA